MKKLICFGDSITAGNTSEDGSDRLIPRLRKSLVGWEVIDAGVSGNNSRDAVRRTESDVLNQSPDFVTVFFGANDAATHKMIMLDEYHRNIRTIVEMIGSEKTLLISPSPVDENRPRNRANEVMMKYAAIIEQIAKSTGCK